MGKGTRKMRLSKTETSSRRRQAERVRAAAKRMGEDEKSLISPKPGRKKYTGRPTGKCAAKAGESNQQAMKRLGTGSHYKWSAKTPVRRYRFSTASTGKTRRKLRRKSTSV